MGERTAEREARRGQEILHFAQIYLEAALSLCQVIPFLAPPLYAAYLFSFFSHHLRPQRQSFLNKRLLAILGQLEYRIPLIPPFSPLFHVFCIFRRAAAYSESKIEAFFFLSTSLLPFQLASVRVRY